MRGVSELSLSIGTLHLRRRRRRATLIYRRTGNLRAVQLLRATRRSKHRCPFGSRNLNAVTAPELAGSRCGAALRSRVVAVSIVAVLEQDLVFRSCKRLRREFGKFSGACTFVSRSRVMERCWRLCRHSSAGNCSRHCSCKLWASLRANAAMPGMNCEPYLLLMLRRCRAQRL